jgi:hypothetical protein
MVSAWHCRAAELFKSRDWPLSDHAAWLSAHRHGQSEGPGASLHHAVGPSRRPPDRHRRGAASHSANPVRGPAAGPGSPPTGGQIPCRDGQHHAPAPVPPRVDFHLANAGPTYPWTVNESLGGEEKWIGGGRVGPGGVNGRYTRRAHLLRPPRLRPRDDPFSCVLDSTLIDDVDSLLPFPLPVSPALPLLPPPSFPRSLGDSRPDASPASSALEAVAVASLLLSAFFSSSSSSSL